MIVQDTSPYPDVLPGATCTNIIPFKFYTTPDFVCGTPIDFSLSVQSTVTTNVTPFRINTGLTSLNPIRFNNSIPTPIPDNDAAGVDSSINVIGVAQPVGKITVSLYLPDKVTQDLTVQLISPEGTNVTLVQGVGAGRDSAGVVIVPAKPPLMTPLPCRSRLV